MKTNSAVRMAYVLLTADRPLTTNEICEKANCERKSVYAGIDILECSGFITTKKRQGNGNVYTCRLREEG